jgi:hypothetical protein
MLESYEMGRDCSKHENVTNMHKVSIRKLKKSHQLENFGMYRKTVSNCVRLHGLTAANTKTAVLWVAAPCRLVEITDVLEDSHLQTCIATYSILSSQKVFN